MIKVKVPPPSPEEAASPATTSPAPWFPQRLLMATLGLLLVVLAIHLLEKFASFLQPLLIAIFLLYVLWPVYRWIVSKGVPSRVASASLLFGALAAFFLLGVTAYWNLDQIKPDRLAEYEAHLDEQLNRFLTWLDLAPREGQVHLRDLMASQEGLNLRFKGALVSITGTLFGFLTAALVVCVYLIFLWMEWAYLPARARKAFGREGASDVVDVVERINDAVGCYLSTMTLVNLMQAILSGIVLFAFGVDFYILYGLLIFALAYIPYLGALISLGFPIVATFVQHPGEPWRGVSVLVLFVAIQLAVDYWVLPRMTGQRLGLSPLLVLLALAFWGYVWGIVGMFLAVPLTVSLKIILEQIEATKPIAVLMSNHGEGKPCAVGK